MKHKFLGSIIASNFRRLPMPLKLSYAITYRCNLKCRMCNIWDKDCPAPELTPDELGKFLAGSRKVYWFGITGGEPFLRSDVFDIVDVVVRNCPDLKAIHFATNGTLTSRIKDFMKRLRQKYPKIQIVATISIDGPRELHEKIRGQQGVWDKALATFQLLKQFPNTKPQFGFTMSHNNLDQFSNTFEALQGVYPELVLDDMTVNIFQQSDFYYENQDMPALNQDELLENIKRIQKIDRGPLSLNNFLRRQYLKLYPHYLKNKKTPVKCQSFSATAFLDPYGNLFPCAVYNRRLLNIKETGLTLKEAWQLNEAEKIRKECEHNECPTCWSPCDAYSAIGGSLIPAFLKQ